MPFRAPRDHVGPIIVLGLATLLSVAACAPASTPSAVPPSPAASSAATAERGPATVAPSLAADAIQHPTGASDVVLRAGTRGGFVRLETVMSRVPEFTLYGDGRVLVLPPDDAATGGGGLNPGAGGSDPAEVPVLGETRLSEAEVQALLKFALVDGRLGTARDAYMGGNMDAPSTVFDLQADGADRSILVTGLTDDPAPGPDAVTLRALSSLIARLRTIVADADYQSDRVEAILAEVEPGPGLTFEPWPWPDLGPADFPQPADDPAVPFPSRVLTADQASASSDLTGGKARLVHVDGPDDRHYALVLRPALPEEIAAAP